MRYCSWYTEEPKYERCYNLVEDGKTRCEEHKKKKTRTGDLTTAQKKAVREAYGNVCAICGKEAYEVDHIRELSDFPEKDQWKANLPSNLQVLCFEHHLRKTNEYRRNIAGDDRYTSARNRKNKRRRDRGMYV